MAAAPVPAVEADGVGGLKPADGAAEVGPGGLDQQVVVIGHEAVGVNAQAEFIAGFLECGKEGEAIVVVAKDGAPLVAARGDVVESPGKFDAKRPGHGGSFWDRVSDMSSFKS